MWRELWEAPNKGNDGRAMGLKVLDEVLRSDGKEPPREFNDHTPRDDSARHPQVQFVAGHLDDYRHLRHGRSFQRPGAVSEGQLELPARHDGGRTRPGPGKLLHKTEMFTRS